MSTKYLSSIDFQGNPALNFVIQNLSSAPGSPVAGQMFYCTSTGGGFIAGSVYVWNASLSAWVEMDSLNLSFGAVTAQTSFGLSSANGSATTASHSDHTHGTPPLSGTAAGNISLASTYKITNAIDPTSAQDYATKNYVDSTAQGVSWKDAVAAATSSALAANTYAVVSGGVGDTLTATTNGALGNIDSIALWTSLSTAITAATNSTTTITATVGSNAGMAVGQPITVTGAAGGTWTNINGSWTVASLISTTQFTFVVNTAPTGSYTASTATVAANAARLLVKNEVTSANDGIYTVTSLGSGSSKYVLTRATDMDAPTAPDTGISKYIGALVFVQSWNGISNTNGGSAWQCVPASDDVTPGTTSLAFNQFAAAGTSYSADETTLHLSGTTFSIKSTYTGQSSITTLGTITTGTWNGTNVAVAYGGTGGTAGAQTAAGARSNLSAAGLFISGSTSTTGGSAQTITHNLNNTTPHVTVWSSNSSGSIVECDVASTGANTITITTASSQTGLYIVCIG